MSSPDELQQWVEQQLKRNEIIRKLGDAGVGKQKRPDSGLQKQGKHQAMRPNPLSRRSHRSVYRSAEQKLFTQNELIKKGPTRDAEFSDPFDKLD